VLAPGRLFLAAVLVYAAGFRRQCAATSSPPGHTPVQHPDCAKRCVHQGKEIVAWSIRHKRLLRLRPGGAKRLLGDYLEIKVTLDEPARLLRN